LEAWHEVIANLPYPEKISVPRRILERLSKAGEVEEAGLLFGETRGREALVEEAVPLAWGVGYFRIDPAEWMKSILDAKERGRDYIGIYHTHSGGQPRPSPLDVRYMMECPGEIWIIYAEGRAAAWVWSNGVRRVELEVV